jgi:hypothetical protein
MTTALAFAIFLASVAPLAVLAVLAAKQVPAKRCVAALVLSALAGIFLFARPHESRFTGTDESMYPLLAESFAAGHPLRGKDPVLSALPPRARLLFSAGNTKRRATRDELFRAVDAEGRDARTGEFVLPWFVPTAPLAASALARFGLSPRLFSPLVGTLFLLVFFLSVSRAAGMAGIFSGVAALLLSPLPAWFFRSLQPEAAGAALVASALAFELAFPRRAGATCAWLLAFSLAYHRSCGLVGAALLGLLFLRDAVPRADAPHAFRRLLAGGTAGFAAGFWLMAKTTTTYQSLLGGTPEKSALLRFALPALALAALAALAVAAVPRVRHALAGDGVRRVFAWAFPLAAVAALAVSYAAGGDLRRGFLLAAWPLFPVVVLACCTWCICPGKSPDAFFRRTAVCLVLFLLPFAFFVLGHEPFTGIWNLRRLLASILPLAVLGAFALARPFRRLPWAGVMVSVFFLVFAVDSVLRHPAAYAGCNERGAGAFARELAAAADPRNRWVLCDSFSFAPALAADPEAKVLGVNRWAYLRWRWAFREFAALPGGKALLTSFVPPTLEHGFELVEEGTVEEDIRTTRGHRESAPRRLGTRNLAAHVLSLKPLAPDGPVPAQRKTFDGGPVGLYGAWGPVARFPRTGDGPEESGQWTREGCGIVGPIPPKGGAAKITLRAGWFAPEVSWQSQTLWIRAPWGKEKAVEVAAGREDLTLSIPCGNRKTEKPTGVYTFRTSRPFNPALHGNRGYPKDLGVLLADIEIEPIAPAP